MINKIENKYRNIFNIREIEESKILQFLFFAISFSLFDTFNSWISSQAITINSFINGTNVCPPYFLSCGKMYFLEMLPLGYSQSFFYVCLYLLLLYGVYSAVKKDWASAHFVILICLIWKIIWGFLFTYGLLGNYDYYDMILAFVFLFLKNKEYFAKVTFVFFYFMASTIKIHEGWIFSNYFRSLYTGAPLFSDAILPFFTNFVILMQIVGAWMLLSKNKFFYWAAFVYFSLFHVYSGVLVHYRYITISIPALFILFGEKEDFNFLKINKSTILGYLFLVFLFVGQMTAIWIPGDQKKTLEGNYYGLYMFEASHQCFSNAQVYFKNSTTTQTVFRENHVANNRCDPYRYFYQLKTICNRTENVEKVSWTFDHSINGHPYERIVDEQNVCDLNYKPFSHNSWIKVGSEAQKQNIEVYKVGYLFPLDGVYEKAQAYDNPTLLNMGLIFYWAIWLVIFVFILGFVIHNQFIK